MSDYNKSIKEQLDQLAHTCEAHMNEMVTQNEEVFQKFFESANQEIKRLQAETQNLGDLKKQQTVEELSKTAESLKTRCKEYANQLDAEFSTALAIFMDTFSTLKVSIEEAQVTMNQSSTQSSIKKLLGDSMTECRKIVNSVQEQFSSLQSQFQAIIMTLSENMTVPNRTQIQ